MEFASLAICPVCGNETFDNWSICPHCWWEYDELMYKGYSCANKSYLWWYRLKYKIKERLRLNKSSQAKSADPITYDEFDKIIPISERFNSGKNELRCSERTGDAVSNRTLLANAFEGLSRNSDEYAMIQRYRNRIRLLNVSLDYLLCRTANPAMNDTTSIPNTVIAGGILPATWYTASEEPPAPTDAVACFSVDGGEKETRILARWTGDSWQFSNGVSIEAPCTRWYPIPEKKGEGSV